MTSKFSDYFSLLHINCLLVNFLFKRRRVPLQDLADEFEDAEDLHENVWYLGVKLS
jgi:hypothetical protein